MKISKATAKLLRFDVIEHKPDSDYHVELTNKVEVVDYIIPGLWTVIITWRINIVGKTDGVEVIGMLHQTTTSVLDIMFKDTDLQLITKLINMSLKIAEQVFNDRVQYQNQLPQFDTDRIALYLLSEIRNQAKK